MIRRVAGLIFGGEAPDRLLCVTFTAKAAGEMRSRLLTLLGPERTPRWVGTFHAVMARLLIEDGSGVPGLPRGFAILGQGDARALPMQAGSLRNAKEAGLLQEAVALLKNHLDSARCRATEGSRASGPWSDMRSSPSNGLWAGSCAGRYGTRWNSR